MEVSLSVSSASRDYVSHSVMVQYELMVTILIRKFSEMSGYVCTSYAVSKILSVAII